jgi:shikimate kinase/3-dehydroquinate synthase
MLREAMRGISTEPEAEPAAAALEAGARRDDRAAALIEALAGRSLVLVGMMGSGKTTVGRRLALRLGLPFVDVDQEIVEAAGMPIADIFARHGEAHFRDGERRVMSRVLAGGPRVVATGGGAFMTEATRTRVAENAVSIWLRADLDTLMRRVRKRATRPLLQTADPVGTMQRLLIEREPVYAQADVTVCSREASHETVVEDVLRALEAHIAGGKVAHGMKSGERVEIGVELPGRRYDILIGENLVREAGTLIAKVAPGASCAIVTDTNIARHHLPELAASLDGAGIRHAAITIPPGESSKSFATYERVCNEILSARMERGDIVVALGGGVVGDLAGFAAASVRRGMRLVQVPTSLLAQVDSSVGGKTGINSPHGKNLIGAFHQPSLVIADTSVLATLPEREFRAGYAEIVKYGLIDDADFFYWLEAEWRAVFAGGPARTRAIAKSCAAKAAVVIRDETEQGDRALLNLGHTFAHAFERLTNYDSARLVHGEAVALGIACAFRFSTAQGLCPGQDTQRVVRHLDTVGFRTRIADIPGWTGDASAILDAMFQDKKVQRGALTLILARGIGQSFIAMGVAAADVQSFLEAELRTGAQRQQQD